MNKIILKVIRNSELLEMTIIALTVVCILPLLNEFIDATQHLTTTDLGMLTRHAEKKGFTLICC